MRMSRIDNQDIKDNKFDYDNPCINSFEVSSRVKTIDLSHLDTSSVTTISYMFSTCTSLKYLIISNFNFNNIQNLGGIYEVSDIFYNLDNLEYIDIYNIKDFNGVLKKEVDKLNNKSNSFDIDILKHLFLLFFLHLN